MPYKPHLEWSSSCCCAQLIRGPALPFRDHHQGPGIVARYDRPCLQQVHQPLLWLLATDGQDDRDVDVYTEGGSCSRADVRRTERKVDWVAAARDDIYTLPREAKSWSYPFGHSCRDRIRSTSKLGRHPIECKSGMKLEGFRFVRMGLTVRVDDKARRSWNPRIRAAARPATSASNRVV